MPNGWASRLSCSRIWFISSSRRLRTASASVAAPRTRRKAELEDRERPLGRQTDGLIELQRIDDAIAREGVDHQLLAGLRALRPGPDLSWLEAITSCAGDSTLRMRLSI